MSGGPHDMRGRPATQQEMLTALGDPRKWGPSDRKKEFTNRLKPGQTELDIWGIKGSPGRRGYLEYLIDSLTFPLGTFAGILSPGENRILADEEQTTIQVELAKYTKLLVELSRSLEAVASYIEDLAKAIEFEKQIASVEGDPEDQPVEELVILGRRRKVERARILEEIPKEMAKWLRVLEHLQASK